MRAYYYLMAQLPYLMYDQKPPMSSEEFKELAVALLQKCDADIISNISNIIKSSGDAEEPAFNEKAPSTGNFFMDKWLDWERTLRQNIARERAIKLKRRDAAKLEPPVFPADAAQAAIKVAIGDGSPLDKEIMLDKVRWNAVESLAGNDYFHRNSVFAYYLKLLLLERKLSFNAEKGFAEYKSLYASIVKSAQTSLGDTK